VTSECFVYIALPGETEFVTAGRFERKADRHGINTGRFVYGKSYLARSNTVPIDPLNLKLSSETYATTRLDGMFGALRDASPDSWGRRVIEKRAGKAQLDEMDYLLHSPDDRAGALGFGLNAEPPAPKRTFNRTMDLAKLQAFADRIVSNEELPDDPDAQQAHDLMNGGTSMGSLAAPRTRSLPSTPRPPITAPIALPLVTVATMTRAPPSLVNSAAGSCACVSM